MPVGRGGKFVGVAIGEASTREVVVVMVTGSLNSRQLRLYMFTNRVLFTLQAEAVQYNAGDALSKCGGPQGLQQYHRVISQQPKPVP